MIRPHRSQCLIRCSARCIFLCASRDLRCLPPPPLLLTSIVRPRSPFDASKYQGYVSPHLDTPAVTYALVVASPPAAKLEAEAKSAKITAVAKAHPELRLGPTGQTFNEAWQARHKKGLPSSRQSTHPR
jgi:hypothetical protein